MDFAVGEADILDVDAVRDVQIGALGEVRVAAPLSESGRRFER
jgi:hypothetical protein